MPERLEKEEEERERVEGVSVLVTFKQCPPLSNEEKRIAITKTASACGGMNAPDGCDGRVLCQRRGNRFASLWTDYVDTKAAK